MWAIELTRHSEISLARQIYQILRGNMLEGELQAGEVLPSSRELAKQLAVSRNTVYEAYEMLSAEGYIVTRPGAPTRVADGLLLKTAVPKTKKSLKPLRTIKRYSADFRTGQPDLLKFPMHLWLELLYKASNVLSADEWGYNGPDGLISLREEIAAWLYRIKGLSVEPGDIFITAGATQALNIVADLLRNQGEEIIVEDPCHQGMLQVLAANEFKVIPIPVDRYGLKTSLLEKNSAAAVYVTPSHQFPLGGILPAERRAELIRFARKNNLYVIEDDYDSEFRYTGPPVAPLLSLDADRVIYVGTFSKILFPALRIGYVVLPRQLHKRWRYVRTHLDVQNSPFEQAALGEFLRSRKLDRHVQQMRRLYGKRRQHLLEEMSNIFYDNWNVWGDAAGLHVALSFPGCSFDQSFMAKCKKAGVRVTPADNHSIHKGKHLDKLLLGYGHLECAEISKGLKLLAKLL